MEKRGGKASTDTKPRISFISFLASRGIMQCKRTKDKPCRTLYPISTACTVRSVGDSTWRYPKVKERHNRIISQTAIHACSRLCNFGMATSIFCSRGSGARRCDGKWTRIKMYAFKRRRRPIWCHKTSDHRPHAEETPVDMRAIIITFHI